MSSSMSPPMAITFLLLFLSLSIPVSSQLFFPGFHHASDNLTLSGIAQIQDNGILKLTNDTSRLLGHAFYTSPIKFKNSSDGPVVSFSTSFVFTIVPEYSELGGHGLAFAISPTKDLMALPSQYLGLINSTDLGKSSNHLFAVEFDTVKDFAFGDINDNHVGIDINSLVSNASAAAGYYVDESTKKDLQLTGGKPIQAWIDYDSNSYIINVTLSAHSNKPKKPLISFHTDLSLIFEEYMYVGFSASTGLLASSHYVLGWTFGIDNVEIRPLRISALPSLPGQKKDHRTLALGLSLFFVVFAILGVLVSIYLVRKLRNADKIEQWELEIGPQRFSYPELKKATNGFKEKELLGQGGFGHVYKGTLPDSKTHVAVKRIAHNSTQGLREFVSEIASIGRLRHRNLVQLLGWCRRRGNLLLVYEFMANGSLDNYLYDKPKMTLNWEQRFHVIKGVAGALLYLHEGYEQVVIHRDVKASNVLLDSELNGRLGDFGLARLYDHGGRPSTTRVVGTMGYLAPEIPRTGKATMSSDVFAFGAFLLEVTCGRRPVEPQAGPEELVLVDVVWDRYEEGKVLEVVDPKLNGVYNEDEVLIVIKLGLMCSSYKQSARPGMRHAVRFLDGEVPLPEDLKSPNSDEFSSEWFDNYVHSFAYSPSELGARVGFTSFSTTSLSTLQGRLHSF